MIIGKHSLLVLLFFLLGCLQSRFAFSWDGILRDLAKEAALEAAREKGEIKEKPRDGRLDIPANGAQAALRYAGTLDLGSVKIEEPEFENQELKDLSVTEIQDIFTMMRTGNSSQMSIKRKQGASMLHIGSLIELFSRVDMSPFSRRTETYQRALADWLSIDNGLEDEILADGDLAKRLFSFLEVAVLYREAAQNTPYPTRRSQATLENEVGKFVHLILPHVVQRLALEIYGEMADRSASIAIIRRNETSPLKGMKLEITQSISPADFDNAIDRLVGAKILGHLVKSLLIAVEKAVSRKKRDSLFGELWARFDLAELVYFDLIRQRLPNIMKESEERFGQLRKELRKKRKETVLPVDGFKYLGYGIFGGGLTGLMVNWVRPETDLSEVLFVMAIGAIAGAFCFIVDMDNQDEVATYEASKKLLNQKGRKIGDQIFVAELEAFLLKGNDCDLNSGLISKRAKELPL